MVRSQPSECPMLMLCWLFLVGVKYKTLFNLKLLILHVTQETDCVKEKYESETGRTRSSQTEHNKWSFPVYYSNDLEDLIREEIRLG